MLHIYYTLYCLSHIFENIVQQVVFQINISTKF